MTVDRELYPDAENIILYPNPCNKTLNLVLEKEQKEIHIIIRDITGKVIEEYDYTNAKKITFNFVASPGLYFVEVNTPTQKTVLKFMNNNNLPIE